MVDYAKVNEALEHSRLEARREIMEEGTAVERASIVAWCKDSGQIVARAIIEAALSEGITEPRDLAACVLAEVMASIERGDHAHPEHDFVKVPWAFCEGIDRR